jgi:tRNA modification GTPase
MDPSGVQDDTIAAIATPAGRGGVGIVRVSGRDTRDIAKTVIGSLPQPRQAQLATFTEANGEAIDQGIALFFAGPHSFTGEDVLELQGHGGPVVMDMLLNRIIACGARLAQPGEFSQRAVLNDKIDLTQAEAIADLIDSVSRRAAKSAVQSLQGRFSERIHVLDTQVVRLRMYIEAAIDFPEEEVDFLADSHIEIALADIEAALVETQQQTQQGALLREGITLVFAGRPNAGKSSLMNHYSGRETSIVTNVPGTTRDIVNEYIHLDGVPLRLVDTAGLRDSDDLVEKEGIRRARQEIMQADIILLLIDYAAHPNDWRDEALRLQGETGDNGIKLVVLNKIDKQPLVQDLDFALPVIGISATPGDGLQELTDKVKQQMGLDTQIEGQFIARSRHLDALHRAALAVAAGKEQLLVHRAGELLAEELRLAHEALNEITGEFSSDDLLGSIFSSFCIGK